MNKHLDSQQLDYLKKVELASKEAKSSIYYEEDIDVLDENGLPVGIALPRTMVHKYGLWHRAIAGWIINTNNEILIQQRSANKDKNPNLWDISFAGHVSAGQYSISTAAREINEEVAVNIGRRVYVKDFSFIT
jgi:isopentenyldiphosphate isomerase